MNRTQKTDEVESLKNKFAASQIAILANYKGLSVAAMTDLRSKLRARQSSLKVVKNRLARIAVKGTDHESLASHFKNTTAVAFGAGDLTGTAKVIADFAKDNEKLEIKVGYLNGKIISLSEVKALASLPSREELIAKMLGSLNAPATNLVNVLVQIPRQLVQVLSAVKDQKEKNV